jgi:hypothetical protein
MVLRNELLVAVKILDYPDDCFRIVDQPENGEICSGDLFCPSMVFASIVPILFNNLLAIS